MARDPASVDSAKNGIGSSAGGRVRNDLRTSCPSVTIDAVDAPDTHCGRLDRLIDAAGRIGPPGDTRELRDGPGAATRQVQRSPAAGHAASSTGDPRR